MTVTSTESAGRRGTRWAFMSRFLLMQNGEKYLWRLREYLNVPEEPARAAGTR